MERRTVGGRILPSPPAADGGGRLMEFCSVRRMTGRREERQGRGGE